MTNKTIVIPLDHEGENDDFMFDATRFLKKNLKKRGSSSADLEKIFTKREFNNLKPSERAALVAKKYGTLKKQSGYRSDLHETSDFATSVPMERRLDTRAIVAKQLDISSSDAGRYIRVDKLIPALKNRLDKDEIALRAAVDLSYLNIKEQELVEGFLLVGNKLSMKQASALKQESGKVGLDMAAIKRILEL